MVPVRSARWMISLSLAALLLVCPFAQARAHRVLVSDLTDLRTHAVDPFAVSATEAVSQELTQHGQPRFAVIPPQEVMAEATAEGLHLVNLPEQPPRFSLEDLKKLAKNLHADAIVQGEVVLAPRFSGCDR